MPFLLLLVLSLTIGFVVGVVVWRYPRIPGTPPAPTLAAARKVGEAAGRHPSLRAVLDARLNPAAATGLALTLALVFVIGGGVLLGVLAYLVRTNSHLIGVDNSVAKWGNSHASATSTHLLNAVTQLHGEHDTWAGLLAAYDAERTAAGVKLVELSRRVGRDQVERTPPWAAMTTADFDAWTKATLSGERPYFYGDTDDG